MAVETIESVLALIEQNPGSAALYQRLGQLYSRAGQKEEARTAYERALALDPADAFTHLYLGNWFYGARRYEEALERFQRAAELLPTEAVSYWCQGDAYDAQGRDDLAERAYETAVRVDPDDRQARKKLAAWRACFRGTGDQTRGMIRSAYRLGQAATTVLLAERWLRTHPDDLGIIHDYAEMLYKMTRYEEAVRVYVDAIERFPDGRWGLYNKLGDLYRYRGDFALAEQWYQKAVEERPEEVASYVFVGAVQARQGKLVRAEETHRRATRCTEGPVDEAHHNLGLVLRCQGRFAEAAECFRKALELCPDYPEATEVLQDVEAALVVCAEGANEGSGGAG
jgi:tetratricopeptide (TPR) repeat protein